MARNRKCLDGRINAGAGVVLWRMVKNRLLNNLLGLATNGLSGGTELPMLVDIQKGETGHTELAKSRHTAASE